MTKTVGEISKLAEKSKERYMKYDLNKELPAMEKLRMRIGYHSGYLDGYNKH
jgi:hypothetical protein